MLLNTMVANDMYSLLNRDNLTQPVQMILSKKLKTFSEYFSSLFKCSSKIEHFEKNDDHHYLCISGIKDGVTGD